MADGELPPQKNNSQGQGNGKPSGFQKPQEAKPVTKPATPAAVKAAPTSRKTLLLSFIALFFFLFVLFFVFLVVMLFQNGGNNPILGALGVEPVLLQQLLQTLISLIFGFLALVSLIVSLIGLFRRFTAAPAELDKKRQSLILGAAAGGFFVFSLFIWIVLYFYISQLQLGTAGNAVISSDPEVTINLTAPIDITFSAQQIEALYTREGIVSYAWDLDGDGAYDDGNGRDIRYAYTSRGNDEGIYNVAVRLILGTAQEVVVQKLVTIANVLPNIVIDYDPKILEVPVEITFDASGSRDVDGTIVSYEWDFDGDGQIDAQGATVSRNFTEAVAQELRLRVTDNNGQASEQTLPLNFAIGRQKEAVIVVRPGLIGQMPFKASFDASNSFVDERIQSYEWDFGDGSRPIQGRLAEHEYTAAGSYTVKLRLQTESGKQYDREETVVVERATNAPVAVIQVKNFPSSSQPIKGEAPLELQFDGGGSTDKDGTIVEHHWDFNGDGVDDAVGSEATYLFIENKTYEVVLKVVDDDELSGSAKVSVQVTTPAIAIDLQVSSYSGPVPLEVTFDAAGSRAQEGKIISYTWDFGDEGSEVIGSARQTHVYTQVGEYVVKVTVVTDDNQRASKEILVVAREIELQAEFTVNPEEPQAGQKVFFDASPSQGQISRYYWEFGDGSISRVVKPDHQYDQAGTYTVTLEVYDRKSRISRKEIQLEVK